MSTPFPFQRPGVYVTEQLLPLPTPQTAPGTAVAAFVGTHNAGPSAPTSVSSWSQFLNLYRGFGTGADFLPYQVYQYFANGGGRAWILRAVSSDAVAASTNGTPLVNVPIPASPTLVPTGPGVEPVAGAGAAPTVAVASATLVQAEQTGLSISWTATGTVSTVDAFQVTCSPPVGGDPVQSSWVPFATGALGAVFTGLVPGTAYTFSVVPWKKDHAGPAMTTAPTYSTSPGYTPVAALRITSAGVGAYANGAAGGCFVSLTQSWTPGRFHLVVKFGSTAQSSVVETWQDVSLDPADPRYAVSLINSPVAGSDYVRIENLLPPGSTTAGTGATPDASWVPATPVVDQPLTGGVDGVVPVSLSSATRAAFDPIGDVLLINLCGKSGQAGGIPDQATTSAVLQWVIERGNAFMLVDAPSVPAPADSAAATTAYMQLLPSAVPPGSQPYASTSFAAMYGPWLSVSDPSGQSVSATRLLAPGGAMLGRYAVADAQVGPHQAAAGTAYPIVGAVGVQHRFTNAQLDSLNSAGCNVVRAVPQTGYCAMGVRTLQAGRPDRYIPVRRMLIYLEDLLVQTTRFAVFSPNGPDLWQLLTALVTQQLTAVMSSGKLQGRTPDQAFFVRCDSTNNTTQTVANGEVHLQVGVALASPAEYIVISVQQQAGGSGRATDNLAA